MSGIEVIVAEHLRDNCSSSRASEGRTDTWNNGVLRTRSRAAVGCQIRIERASMYDVWFRCIGMAVVPPRVEYWSSIVEMST